MATLQLNAGSGQSSWVLAGLTAGIVAGIIFALFEMITSAVMEGAWTYRWSGMANPVHPDHRPHPLLRHRARAAAPGTPVTPRGTLTLFDRRMRGGRMKVMRVTRGTLGRATLLGLASGAVALLVVGVPTAVIPNPGFTRMVPTRPQDYVVLGITALLAGLLGATYALPGACPIQGKVSAGGVLSFLAVGCPICNKVVVLLLGTGGALTYFEPLQPLLALVSIALLGFGLYLRIRAVRSALGSPSTGDVTASRQAQRFK